VLTIICSITKISGIYTGISVDSVWEAYWQFITANVALTMTSATAFRIFFVVNGTEKLQASSDPLAAWYCQLRQLLSSSLTTRLRRSKASGDNSEDDRPLGNHFHLSPQVPRGTMTGVRTVIKGQDKTTLKPSQVMHSRVDDGNEDPWPLSGHNVSIGVIGVQQDITLQYEDAC
jgi:hypothetical protein